MNSDSTPSVDASIDDEEIRDEVESQNVKRYGTMRRGVVGLFVVAINWLFWGAAWLPTVEWVEDNFNDDPTLLELVLVIQVVFYTPVIAFGLAVAIAMLLNRAVLVRFLIAIACAAPGLMATYYIMAANDAADDAGFWVVISIFPAAACVAGVVLQLWSGWTICHGSEISRVSNPLGIRALMELTLLMSVLMVLATRLEVEGLWIGIAAFAFFGVIIAVISFFSSWCFLGERIRWLAVIGVAGPMSWIVSTIALFLYSQEGFDAIYQDTGLLLMSVYSLIGAGILCGMITGTFLVLRLTGWRFVRYRN